MKVWFEPEECLQDFTSSLILTKFKIEMRKELNISLVLAKICD